MCWEVDSVAVVDARGRRTCRGEEDVQECRGRKLDGRTAAGVVPTPERSVDRRLALRTVGEDAGGRFNNAEGADDDECTVGHTISDVSGVTGWDHPAFWGRTDRGRVSCVTSASGKRRAVWRELAGGRVFGWSVRTISRRMPSATELRSMVCSHAEVAGARGQVRSRRRAGQRPSQKNQPAFDLAS